MYFTGEIRDFSQVAKAGLPLFPFLKNTILGFVLGHAFALARVRSKIRLIRAQ
jgi:hypothetical protein